MTMLTRVDPLIGASGTKTMSPTKSSDSSLATSIARRVLPTPPGPVSVSSCTPGWRRKSQTAATSCSRPMSDVSGCGKDDAGPGRSLRNAIISPGPDGCGAIDMGRPWYQSNRLESQYCASAGSRQCATTPFSPHYPNTLTPSLDHDVAAQEAVGVANQDRLAALRAAAMGLWIVLGDEPRIAQCVDREVDRGVDVAALQRPARIEVLRPGAAHAVGHQFQLDGVDLFPAVRPVARTNPLQTHGVLDMVRPLMSDDKGGNEFIGLANLQQLGFLEVDRLVGRAVERVEPGRGRTAACVDAVALAD